MVPRRLRLVRAIRFLSTLTVFKRARVFATTLHEGRLQVAMVFSFLIFFVCSFGIVGMAILQSSFRRSCVVASRTISSCASDFTTGWNATCDFRDLNSSLTELQIESRTDVAIAGGYPFQKSCKIIVNETAGEYDGEFALDAYGRYHTCPDTEMCESLENPGLTFSHFDNIGGAVLTMFQAGIPDSYYDIIHRALGAEPLATPLLWLLFFSITCVITFLILGLFIAVVTGTYDRVSRRHAVAGSNDPTDVILRTTSAQTGSGSTGESGGRSRGSDLKRFIRTLLSSAVTVTHFFAMATDQYDSSEDWREILKWTYVACNGAFALDLLVRFLLSKHKKAFFARPRNMFESCLTLCGSLGIVARETATGPTGIEKVLLFLPAFRLYRLMQFLPTLELLLLSAVASTHALLDLVFFVALLCFCFTVVGRYLFGDSMNELARSNFGSLPRAFLTMFQLFMGDSWSSVLYTAIASQDHMLEQALAACFVLCWLFLSKFIIENLFISVIIQNFQIAELLDSIKRPGVASSIRGFIVWAYSGFPESAVVEKEKLSISETIAVGHTVQKAALKLKTRHPRLELDRGHTVSHIIQTHLTRAEVKAGADHEKLKKHKEEEEEDEDNDEIVLILFHKSNYIRRCVKIFAALHILTDLD